MSTKTTWIKLTRWEFWPTYVIYFPVALYYGWLAIRSRSFFFFSLANPGIEMGGLYGASKYKQLQQLSEHLKPKTVFCPAGMPTDQLIQYMESAGISFPIILKPDCGERGKGVQLIRDQHDLANLPLTLQTDCVLQAYIDYPFEAGVFFIKIPGEEKGHIPSIVIKEFLSVKGDGKSSLKALIEKNNRALLVREKLLMQLGAKANEVLKDGEERILEPIGNHNRGTKFIDGRVLINPVLEQVFTEISAQLVGFNYGRFDLRAPGLADFQHGKNLKILEVNGVNAEPAHIYDPQVRLLTGVCTLLRHWKFIYTISMRNKKLGHTAPKFKEAVVHYKNWQLSDKK